MVGDVYCTYFIANITALHQLHWQQQKNNKINCTCTLYCDVVLKKVK